MSKIHIQYRILYIRFLNTKQPIPIIIRSIAHTCLPMVRQVDY